MLELCFKENNLNLQFDTQQWRDRNKGLIKGCLLQRCSKLGADHVRNILNQGQIPIFEDHTNQGQLLIVRRPVNLGHIIPKVHVGTSHLKSTMTSIPESVNWGISLKILKHWNMPCQYHIITSFFQDSFRSNFSTDWEKLEGRVPSTFSSVSKYTLLNISNRQVQIQRQKSF